MRQITGTAQLQQPQEPDPVAVPDSVQMPIPAATPLSPELLEEPMMDDTRKETGSEEQTDHSVPVTEPSEDEVLPVRRSTRAMKHREMLTYGQPSYQPWRPGAMMFAPALEAWSKPDVCPCPLPLAILPSCS